MPLPLKTAFTDSTVTEGGFKTALDNMRDWLALMLGTVDGYMRMVRGTTLARPSATEGGWLRWNTDNTEMEISYGTSWQQVIRSTPDATWKWSMNTGSNVNGARVIGTGVSQKFRVESTADSIDLKTSAADGSLELSGTRPFKIRINGVTVMSIDSAGNLSTKADITANATL